MSEITNIITEYYPVKNPDTNCNFLKCELYYHLGGYNYFTSKQERRGYYLSVCPIHKSKGIESYIGFSGQKILLREVTRKNKKVQAEAENLYKDVIHRYMKMICPQYETEEKI